MTTQLPPPAAPLPTDPSLTRPSPTPGRRGLAPLLMRLHFYAGILVAPFIVVAAATGLLYTLAPQIDQVFYGDQLRVAEVGDRTVPLAEQVASAQAFEPGLDVASVRVSDDPARTTTVTFTDPALADDRQRSVYVDPYSAEVTGELVTWSGSTPAVTTLDDLHRNLLLGDLGRNYSEIAASWLWVVALGGLVLWLRRRRGAARIRRTVLPDLSATGRRRTVSWHGATGVWLLIGLLFLSVTGLTWSRFAGERFSALLESLDATNPGVQTVIDGAGGPAAGAHAGHGGASAVALDVAQLEVVVAAATDAGVGAPYVVTPAGPGTAWTVAEDDDRWPVQQDEVAVDPVTGEVIDTNLWSHRPVLSKLSTLGVAAHMGLLLGPVNQVLLAALALGLLGAIFWGYRAWWQRRPRRDGPPVGRAPRRGAWREVHPVALAALVLGALAVGWALPWLGWTLLAFLVLDAGLGAWRARGQAAPRRQPGRPRDVDDEEELLV